MTAYEDLIRNTASADAPWNVVPVDNKWFTRVVVVAAIVDALASLNLHYPKVSAEKLKELAAAKRVLLGRKRRRSVSCRGIWDACGLVAREFERQLRTEIGELCFETSHFLSDQ
jgi:hypothetical protein